jgi:pyridoxal phosphate enzyme (YggS family)
MSADLPRRLAEVRERIAGALERSGRGADEVTIVAVTKTYPAAAVLAARDAGLSDVGENRVQELAEKVEVVGRDAVTWHLIGHLQRNKARRALPTFDLLHSLDTVRLARELSDAAVAAAATVRVLVQVNAAREGTKSGFEPEALVDALGEICALPALRVEGLMTMAPFTDDPTVLRRTFAEARRLRDEARGQLPTFRGGQLSMGMSNDYEIAVEEGSTLVRLGTVLFGARPT